MKRTILLSLLAVMTLSVSGQNYRSGHEKAYDDHAQMVRKYGGCMPHRDYVYSGYMASSAQVDRVLKVIRKTSFDDNKLEVAKLCVTLCPFSVRDLGRIAKLLSFDDNRLEFLKYAYQYCPEREHYYVLREVMTYRSNADKLSRFIVDNQRNGYGNSHNGSQSNRNGYYDRNDRNGGVVGQGRR